MMKTTRSVLFVALTLALSPATASTADLAEVRQMLEALLERVDQLEKENAQLISRQDRASDKGVSFKGDVRYRYESIDVESRDTRERNRVRARISATAKPADGIEAGIGLASGGSDPVSTNQTLGNGGSSKGVVLDLAYFKWQATPSTSLVAGKFKNVFNSPDKHPLLWDGDLNPEGFALTTSANNWFTNAAVYWLDSDTRNRSARFLAGVQSGFTTPVGEGAMTAGAGYYNVGVSNQAVFYGDDDDFFGNSFTCADPMTTSGCTYDHDYRQLQLFAQFKTSFDGKPLKLFAEYVNNSDADRFSSGWEAGINLGKAGSPGTWQLGYTYRNLEADAVFGLFADSDFGGGGTDAKGHIIKGAFAVQKNWKLGLTFFANESGESQGAETGYDRLQIDSEIKF